MNLPIVPSTSQLPPTSLSREEKQTAQENSRRGSTAYDEGGKLADEAQRHAKAAIAAHARIRAHNEEISGKFNKPKNWTEFDTHDFRYRGYFIVDTDRKGCPHGEGESEYASGHYHCAKFDRTKANGLSLHVYPDRAQSAGWEAPGKILFQQIDPNVGGVFVGRFMERSGDSRPALKHGGISYPDGSEYRGYADFLASLGHIAPDGFGCWTGSPNVFGVQGFFSRGFIDGPGEMLDAHGKHAAIFKRGRLIRWAR
jgi:hypothetical protein